MPMVSPGVSGLVSWWSLDEASGTRNDSHGSNHMAVGGGAPGSAAGKQGNGVDLEAGTSDYLTCASPSPQTGAAFTVAGWIYLETVTNGTLFTANASLTNGFRLRTLTPGSNGLQFTVVYGSGLAYNVHKLSFLATGTWFFVWAQHDGVNTAQTSYNAVAPAVVSNAPPLACTAAWGIGGTGIFQDGILDEWCLYSRALSADELSWLYNGGSGRSYSELAQGHPVALRHSAQGRRLFGPRVGGGAW